MYQINIHQAKTQLSKLVEEAALGEEIIIAKAGKPIARLVSLEKIEHNPRVPGSMKGQIGMADNFDEPMSKEELALWYTAPIFPGDE
jgi:prevent-host-death family protein